jgi:hypothetical protein
MTEEEFDGSIVNPDKLRHLGSLADPSAPRPLNPVDRRAARARRSAPVDLDGARSS